MSKSSTTTRAAAIPNRVTAHPGEVLSEEFLRPLGMSVNALAMALRVPATRIGAVVRSERSVTANLKLRSANPAHGAVSNDPVTVSAETASAGFPACLDAGATSES